MILELIDCMYHFSNCGYSYEEAKYCLFHLTECCNSYLIFLNVFPSSIVVYYLSFFKACFIYFQQLECMCFNASPNK